MAASPGHMILARSMFRERAPAPLHLHGLVHSSGEKVPASGSRLIVEPLKDAFLDCQERHTETQTPEGGGLEHHSLLVR